MKKLLLALLAATISTSAFAASEGRLIGDGKMLPREFVKGKAPLQRRNEIITWMIDRGARPDHLCNAEEKRCVDVINLPLTDGSHLRIRVNTYFDTSPTLSTYCHMASTNDIDSCYIFETGKYYIAVMDGVTGQWEMVWDQRNPPSQQQSYTSSDIEM